jgi:S-adenosylmethionine hydrolase
MSAIDSTNGKIVVLLSDFGYRDGYAGIMKGKILSLDPEIRIVDLTHQIDAHNVLSGAYVLCSAWVHFPPESVFCAVVDPGVGSRRGTVLAEFKSRILIAPDNGLISLLVRMIPGGRVSALELDSVLELSGQDPSLFEEGGTAASSTFHGRDLFAPAAALCATGLADKVCGRVIEPVVLPEAVPQYHHNRMTGAILHIDRFGNCISSVHSTDLSAVFSDHDGTLSVECAGFHGNRISRTYADVPIGEPLCLIGSSGFLEIAAREASAAQLFGITQETPLIVAAEQH